MHSVRRIAEIPIQPAQLAALKEKMLNWSSRFSISLFLDSNGYEDRYGRYECLMGAGAHRGIMVDDATAFRQLRGFCEAHRDWLFGHLCYDLKNVLEPYLQSRHEKRHGYRQLQFFVPEVVCLIPRGRPVLRIESLAGDPAAIGDEIVHDKPARPCGASLQQLQFRSRLSREDYLQRIASLKQHIRDGDCYEITFCNESYAEGIHIDPRLAFKKLNGISPAPFAAFYQDEGRAMIGASPERFLMKEGHVLRSQPIKGTARRSPDSAVDAQLREELRSSEKEQAENVMITDLVRNDLARSCEVGSISVEELFGIYSFPQVHQMISTISGTLRDNVPFTDAIKAAFPMGSMTGAPKHRVMQLIEQYECARRELFSGSVGYISPEGDFDFNVVIRSLFYNADTHYLSYQTGGAITWGSDPESEWEELRLKAAAMERIFS
jgi:para-aminobenzoate synthetase component 1